MAQQRSPSFEVRRPSRLARALRWAGLVVPLVLVACADPAAREFAAAAPGYFDDAAFAPPTEPVDPAEVFRLTPEMTAYIHDVIRPASRDKGVRAGLTDALYTRSQLQLEYDATITRNAAQAFEARQGNCLSLTIMTAAFAKALNLDVTFQQVGVEESWSRTSDLYFMNGHVNLQLQRRAMDGDTGYDRFGVTTIDFLPPPDTAGLRVRPIGENTVLAMYMNNRAAEALAVGQVDDAYWRAREAMRLDPHFLSAYNTLAVVYLRHGDAARAVTVLRAALAQSPDDAPMLANDAQALRRLGREPEAAAVEARLVRLEPYPPFFFYNRGEAALRAGDLLAARALFKRELQRAPDYHEFHYGLAVADFGLGLVDEARGELAIALENSTRRTDHDLYAAKLDKLKAGRLLPRRPVDVQ